MGLVALSITEVPGSRATSRRGRGLLDEVKESALGVPADLLEAHGAVSAQVARAMAEGASAGSARTGRRRDRHRRARRGSGPPGSDVALARGRGRSPTPTAYAARPCGVATGARTSAQRGAAIELLLERVEPRPRARRRQRPRDAAARPIGAGLAPADRRTADPAGGADPRRRGSRGGRPRRRAAGERGPAPEVDGCDPGGPSPYTPALEAPGRGSRPSTTPRTSPPHAGPSRLAVTKALTAIDPDHPELRRARGGSRGAVAAARRRRCRGRPRWSRRRDARQEHDGGLAGPRAARAGRPGPSSGRCCRHAHRRAAATARHGAGTPFVVEADEYAGNFDPTDRTSRS